MRTTLLTFLTLLMACDLPSPSSTSDPESPTPVDAAEDLLVSLREEAGNRFAVTFQEGRVVGLQLVHPVTPTVEGFEAALAELDAVIGLSAISDLEPIVLREERREDTATTHVVFGLSRAGVVVADASLGMHAIATDLAALDIHLPELSTLADPDERSLDPRQAESFAEVHAATTYQTVERVGETLLRIRGPHVVWQVTLSVGGETAGGTLTVDVDANTGDVVHEHLEENPEVDFDVYDAQGLPASQCWEDRWFFFPVCDQDGCDTGAATESWSARFHTDEFNTFLRNVLSRDGIDGRGGDQVAHINVTLPKKSGPDNAYYSPSCDHIAFSPGMAEQEVVAHEWGHGILRKEGIGYDGRNVSSHRDAIHEHMGDMYGFYYERWQDQTDLDFVLGSTPITNVRNIDNGPTVDHVSQMGTNDHANGELLTYAMLLLTRGGTHSRTQVPVRAVDPDAVLQILHRSAADCLPGNPTFADYRRGLLTEAIAAGWSAEDQCQLGNALGAVGIGDVDTDCDGVSNAQETDDDGDGVGDAIDNCPFVANLSQRDTDLDMAGDACDDDLDNDGVDNALDICPAKANAAQIDSDGDGQGDACDDSDADGHEDGVDNCPQTFNATQGDLDRDGQGDACDDDRDGDGVDDLSDNCVTRANPSQADLNDDGEGDVCDDTDDDGRFDASDRCPFHVDGRVPDRDRDGRWDSCEDDDDDDDTVLDEEDNCRFAPNPGQGDFDEDGLGDACDACPEDRNAGRDLDGDGLDDACDPYFDFRRADLNADVRCLMWGCDGQPDLRELEIAIWTGQHLHELPEIPLPTCVADCPERYDEDWTVTVDASSDYPYGLAVVDQRGSIVARTEGTEGPSSITFRPATSTPQGTHTYRLVVRPYDLGDAFAAPMDLEVRAGRPE
ncbi:MAG: thrombospondin type 3 repeat-containing protein [Myxococcota bacterium]